MIENNFVLYVISESEINNYTKNTKTNGIFLSDVQGVRYVKQNAIFLLHNEINFKINV